MHLFRRGGRIIASRGCPRGCRLSGCGKTSCFSRGLLFFLSPATPDGNIDPIHASIALVHGLDPTQEPRRSVLESRERSGFFCFLPSTQKKQILVEYGCESKTLDQPSTWIRSYPLDDGRWHVRVQWGVSPNQWSMTEDTLWDAACCTTLAKVRDKKVVKECRPCVNYGTCSLCCACTNCTTMPNRNPLSMRWNPLFGPMHSIPRVNPICNGQPPQPWHFALDRGFGKVSPLLFYFPCVAERIVLDRTMPEQTADALWTDAMHTVCHLIRSTMWFKQPLTDMTNQSLFRPELKVFPNLTPPLPLSLSTETLQAIDFFASLGVRIRSPRAFQFNALPHGAMRMLILFLDMVSIYKVKEEKYVFHHGLISSGDSTAFEI